MFTLDDGQLVLAATDLTNHLACPHLTQQKLAIARGDRGKPPKDDDPHAELIRRRGDEHETAQLAVLSEQCGGHVNLDEGDRVIYKEPDLRQAAARTAEAMRAGEPLIYQAHFFDGRWQGRTDFLRRVDGAPSDLGDYAYEVLDTKLARQVKPAVVHQLSLYSRLVGLIQGVELPHAHVIMGDGTSQAVELKQYSALHRHTVARLDEIVEGETVATYPEPVPHCPICPLESECHRTRVADDHLSLVAGARRDQREQLVAAGIATVTTLAQAPEHTDAGRMGADRLDLLRNQAALQVESRTTGEPKHRHLPALRAAGYAALPPASAGDVFFDFEGDPYVGEDGLEYLWGWWDADGDYQCLWAHDADEEKAALEAFIDYVTAQRERHPGMHVYHYAPHERSKLGSLSVRFATREAEVDQMLRDRVLVDLYAVVRHAMQVGESSYSLKRFERHHRFQRLEHRVREGGGSIIAYEKWLAKGDEEWLEAIRAYNEEDCLSTQSLRDWLTETMAPAAQAELGVDFDELRRPEDGPDHEPPVWLADVEALAERLTKGMSADGHDDTADQAERRLLSHLLLYHYRESKPQWWLHYALMEMTDDELVYEREAVGGLARDESVPPEPIARSLKYRFTFPAQEVKLPAGKSYKGPGTEQACNVAEIGDRYLVIKRHASDPAPAPTALVANGPPDTKPLREALTEVAESVLAGDGRFAAVRALTRGEDPRLASGSLGEDVDSLVSATLGLDRSILPVQGPPGTGKTFCGARVIVAALQAGKRVGITASSHAAVHNMLRDVEKYADEIGCELSAKCYGGGYESTHDSIEYAGANGDLDGAHQLVAGTPWLFARGTNHEQLDLLFVDEAGQMSLASCVAAGAAAHNLVFLGDPQQLPQVTQSDHPGGSAASVLEHLLEGEATISPGRGVLLTETWRMHPDVCDFVSEHSYDGRLHSRAKCAQRGIDAPSGSLTGTGLRVLAVRHEQRSQSSLEEAEAIAAACRDLLDGGAVTDADGATKTLAPDDIMIVAPYNLAVRRIAAEVPSGVRVGTVDKFQGQQAAVVFYAMTCSSGDDVPRGPDFLFSRNRLNVAVSRTQCLAVMVLSPALLDADCRTVEAMELVDGVCRFGEMAGT